MHAGEWPKFRRDALASSIASRVPAIVGFCGTRHSWELPGLPLFDRHPSRQRQLVCRRMSASGRSIQQFRNTFLFAQPSRIVCVETQWTTESVQRVRRFGRSKMCLWITLIVLVFRFFCSRPESKVFCSLCEGHKLLHWHEKLRNIHHCSLPSSQGS